MYRKILTYLCRREVRKINKSPYPHTTKELVAWHDFMAIYFMDKDRLLGIMVCTSNALEAPGDRKD